MNNLYFRIFYTYTNDYKKNSELFLELQEKYPKFKNAVNLFQQTPICNNKPITTYLLEPVQRLPRLVNWVPSLGTIVINVMGGAGPSEGLKIRVCQ